VVQRSPEPPDHVLDEIARILIEEAERLEREAVKAS
jgi:predicted DNA-binding transcriptional regulator